jgi:hypothetical protein
MAQDTFDRARAYLASRGRGRRTPTATPTLQPVSREAALVLNLLTAGLENPYTGDNSHRKIDNTDGTFMPVVVERIGANTYSVAHYGVQMGDLMADPEMTFLHRDGEWYALTVTQHYVGRYAVGVELGHNEEPERIDGREHRDQTNFAGLWMRNVKDQQNIDVRPDLGRSDSTPPTCPALRGAYEAFIAARRTV